MAAASRHPLLVGTRWLLPVAIAMAALGAVVPHLLAARVVSGVVAVLGGFGWQWQARHRATLVLDDAGYAIEERGREKLRVAWSDVQKVRLDRKESALYVDCGDKARNLFVPPGRGYGFRFADAEALCARVLQAVPAERVVEVERIDVP